MKASPVTSDESFHFQYLSIKVRRTLQLQYLIGLPQKFDHIVIAQDL